MCSVTAASRAPRSCAAALRASAATDSAVCISAEAIVAWSSRSAASVTNSCSWRISGALAISAAFCAIRDARDAAASSSKSISTRRSTKPCSVPAMNIRSKFPSCPTTDSCLASSDVSTPCAERAWAKSVWVLASVSRSCGLAWPSLSRAAFDSRVVIRLPASSMRGRVSRSSTEGFGQKTNQWRLSSLARSR